MSAHKYELPFEKPIHEIEARISEIEDRDGSEESRESIRVLYRELTALRKKIFSNLTPWETVLVSRHPERPMAADYIDLVFDEFVELHGDRFFGDDRAIRTGWAKIDGKPVMFVAHQKGRTIKERQLCNFGFAHPEGYRKAMLKMKQAEKFGLPVVCLIDTGGAYPGVGAEERGQAYVIAKSMMEMSRLKTPVVCVVIGEGGSGGALGIAVGNKVAMLEFSYYSVISPEGCAGILWKDHIHKEKAANALQLTSKDLFRLGIVDDVIQEPLGGAHRDEHATAASLKLYLQEALAELQYCSEEELVEQRYQRFRKLGVFLETE